MDESSSSAARYVPLASGSGAPQQQQQRQQLSPPDAGLAASQAAAASRLQMLGRRFHAAGANTTGAVVLPDAASRAAQRSRSAGKLPARPLADGKAAPRNTLLLPSQMPSQLRQRDKLVLLPRSASEQREADVAAASVSASAAAAGGWQGGSQPQRSTSGEEGDADGVSAVPAEAEALLEADLSVQQQPATSLFVDLTEVLPDSRGRVTVYCIAGVSGSL
jgi:hypothetical protein